LTSTGRRPVNKTRRNLRDRALRMQRSIMTLRSENFAANKSIIFPMEKELKGIVKELKGIERN